MLAALRHLALLNSFVLRLGRHLAWVALALMVVVILAQVFFRYVVGSALAWPDEAARFLMLWMTALMAPSALRAGGFVSIDMAQRALPRLLALGLGLILLCMSLTVLLTAVGHGHNHTFGFGGNFNSSSLKLPLDWFGLETVRVKLRYMHMSLFVCVLLMISVCVELILRTIARMLDAEADLPGVDPPDGAAEGA